MILELLTAAWLLGAAQARAAEPADPVEAPEAVEAEEAVEAAEDVEAAEAVGADPPAPVLARSIEVEAEWHADDELSKYRRRFDLLADQALGTTSRPVAFDWRRTDVQVAWVGSYLAELNNFNSLSTGLMLRFPSRTTLFEVGARWTEVWDSQGSRLLAYTPYRQAGRPDRIDLDFALVLPLAEGIVTTATRYFPAVQLVFNGYGGVRYALYPQGFQDMSVGQIARAVLAPQLTDTELHNLESARLDAMKLDPGRYALLLGLGNDIYFSTGFFLSPRVQVAVPLLAPASRTDLLMWADLSIAAGFAW